MTKNGPLQAKISKYLVSKRFKEKKSKAKWAKAR